MIVVIRVPKVRWISRKINTWKVKETINKNIGLLSRLSIINSNFLNIIGAFRYITCHIELRKNCPINLIRNAAIIAPTALAKALLQKLLSKFIDILFSFHNRYLLRRKAVEFINQLVNLFFVCRSLISSFFEVRLLEINNFIYKIDERFLFI